MTAVVASADQRRPPRGVAEHAREGSTAADATICGLQPHYPCCTVTLPQGWPKLAAGAVLVLEEAEQQLLLYNSFISHQLASLQVHCMQLLKCDILQ